MGTGIKKLMKPSSDLRPCNDKIYKNGEPVTIMWGGSAKLIDRFVKELAELSGQPVDWHYVAGRAVVRTTGNMQKVKETMHEMRLYFSEDL